MKNVENKNPIFELGFSTKFLNEVERKGESIKPALQKKLDVIDKSEHLTHKEKMSSILNIRRKEEENWYIKTLVYSGLFNSYIAHCEYLIYACNNLNAFAAGSKDSIYFQKFVNKLSSSLEKLKEYDLKHIENLIFKVDNSFHHEETDEDYELFRIDFLTLVLFISAEKVDFYDGLYRNRRQQKNKSLKK